VALIEQPKAQPVTLLERVAASSRFKRVARDLNGVKGLRPYHKTLVDSAAAALNSPERARFSELALAAIVLRSNLYVDRQTVRQLELWAVKAYRDGRIGEWHTRHAKEIDALRSRYALLGSGCGAGDQAMGSVEPNGIEVSEITWEEFAAHVACSEVAVGPVVN
jgi:hypothetical protein